MRIAIIGAGFSGSLLAQRLGGLGHEIRVLEKSRGCGGRGTHKRLPWGEADMGAGVVRTGDPAFSAFLSGYQASGITAAWRTPAYRNQGNHWSPLNDSAKHYVFVPGMNRLCRHLLGDTPIRTEFRVQHLQATPQGWQLWDDRAEVEGPFDWVISTAPWPQTQPLLAPHMLSLPAYQAEDWLSCWSVALHLETTLDTPINVAMPQNSRVQMLLRDSAKPGRDPGREIWVVQFSHDYSARLKAQGVEEVWRHASEALGTLLAVPEPKVLAFYQHYWRFARAARSATLPGILLQPASRLAAVGDWSVGGSLEAAWRAVERFVQQWRALSLDVRQ